ncbi:MAG TPA: DegT/DnrJ/EryC1/StrS family aminotransferase, partial [Euzebyales bacterium]|nr:DegT/DnrJ/EryC1/StrS family aminotransferase [Euzebyales bacterium]
IGLDAGGDELVVADEGAVVPVSDFTVVASANAIRYCGADPLLVDSEPATWNMHTELLHDRIVRRARLGRALPSVIEVVHVLGHPAAMEPLLDLRMRYGIRIVEDAAEALGASWRTGKLAGRQVGTVGDLGCFSFNGNKIMTTGGGGMITTDDAELAARARHLVTQAKLPGPGYVHDEIGYNYRLTNIAAAVGVAQLEQLPGFLAAKRRIAARYNDAFTDLPVMTPPHAVWAEPSWWLYSVLLAPDAGQPEQVAEQMAARGIQTRPLWRPLHRQPPYASALRVGGVIADLIWQRGLSLPCSVGLTDSEQDRVIEALRATVGSQARPPVAVARSRRSVARREVRN